MTSAPADDQPTGATDVTAPRRTVDDLAALITAAGIVRRALDRQRREQAAEAGRKVVPDGAAT